MPYGIPGETPEMTKKMESCVSSMLGDPKFKKGEKPENRKSSAIAMCKASMMKPSKEAMSQHRFTFDVINLAEGETSSVIEVLRCGSWDGMKGQFAITESTLQDFVSTWEQNAYGTELQVNIAHQREGEAAGWIKEVYRQGKKLLAKVEWNTLGLSKIKDKIYKYISAELAFQYRNEETGQEFRNVLMGAALTNIPYVRGLAPVQLSESLFPNFSNMETFKLFLDSVMKQDKVSLSDVELLKKMHATLSDDDQTATAADVEKVEEKVEGETPAEGTPAEGAPAAITPPETTPPAGEPATPAEGTPSTPAPVVPPAEPAQPNLSEGKTYTAKEVEAMLSEQTGKWKESLTQIRAFADKANSELRKQNISKQVATVTLSQASFTGGKKKIIGIPPAMTPKVQAFMEQLSDAMQPAFLEIVRGIKEVDFSEIGSGAGKPGEDNEDAKLAAAQQLSEEKKIPLRDALEQIERGQA